jgi:hypothetical protein
MVALYLTLASVTALYCLLGYWLAFGTQYWLWRAAAVCIALALLVPIRAYEPLVFFGITSLLFVAAAAFRHLYLWWREKRRKASVAAHPAEGLKTKGSFQFRLHDLLGLTAVVGLAAWMTRTFLREEVLLPWTATWIVAAFTAALTLAAKGLVAGPQRVVSAVALVVLCACPFAVFYFRFRFLSPFPFYIVGDYLGDYLFASFPEYAAIAAPVGVLLFVLFLVLGFWLAGAFRKNQNGSSRGRILQGISATMAAAWFAAYAWLYCQLLSFPQSPSTARQAANPLPRILARGERIEFVPPAQARAIAGDILALAEQPGFVALPWNGTYSERRNFDLALLVQIQTARSIGRGLDAQVTALEPTNPDAAADHAVGILRIGAMFGHEGQILHSQVGTAIEEAGRIDIARLRTKVSPQKERDLLQVVQQVEASREPLETVIEREEAWRDLHDRWRFRLYKVLVLGKEAAVGWEGRECYDQVHERQRRYICSAQLLVADLAIRAYQRDHGEYPANLELLAPDYLSQVPLDPFSNKPFQYRCGVSDFVLYSIGSDGVDNGGEFGNLQQVTYHPDGLDWDLDALTRP